MAIQDKFVVMSLGVYQQELAVVFRGVCFFVCLPVFFRDEGKVIEFFLRTTFSDLADEIYCVFEIIQSIGV